MSDEFLIGSLNNSILLFRVNDCQFVLIMAHMKLFTDLFIVKSSATISEVSYRFDVTYIIHLEENGRYLNISTQMLKYALGCFISSNSFGRMEFYPT